TLSAVNGRSRFAARSPCWTLGSVLGGSIGFGGSGSTASARAGRAAMRANAAAAARVDAEIGNRLIMGASLVLDRGSIKTRFGRDFGSPGPSAAGASTLGPGSALAGLEPALDLVDDVDAALAADEAGVSLAGAQRLQGVAHFHLLFSVSLVARAAARGAARKLGIGRVAVNAATRRSASPAEGRRGRVNESTARKSSSPVRPGCGA